MTKSQINCIGLEVDLTLERLKVNIKDRVKISKALTAILSEKIPTPANDR